MLVTDLIEAIENYLEITPEECSKTTNPVGVRTKRKSYSLPWMAKPVRREGRESDQQFAYRKFFSSLIKHGFRHMGQNEGRVTKEELVSELWAYYPKALLESHLKEIHAQDFNHSTSLARKARGQGVADTDSAIEAAAGFVLHDFSLETYKKIQARNAEAGRKSKYSVTQYLETRGMTVTRAARHLGWARGTVYAMRAYYANVNLETGEVDE